MRLKDFKWIVGAAMFVFALALFATTSAQAGDDKKVTLCHAAGQDGTTKYVTITVGYPAAFGPAGHFYENGTPRAGHEQDYLGECREDPPPPPNDPKCPEGYVQEGGGEGYILCLRTIQTPGPERIIYVTREVPGPERVVEVIRTIEVPGPERIVEKPVVVTKTKVVTKIKRVTVVKWKTKVVKKKVPVVGVCRIPGTGTAAVQGNG